MTDSMTSDWVNRSGLFDKPVLRMDREIKKQTALEKMFGLAPKGSTPLWTARIAVENPDTGAVSVQKRNIYASRREDARKIAAVQGHVLSLKENPSGPTRLTGTGRDQKVSFLRSLRFQISGGTSPTKAVANAIREEKNAGFRHDLQPALDVIEGGGRLHKALRATGLFDDVVLMVIETGEDGGDLRRALDEAIEYVERRNNDLKKLTVPLAWLTFDVFSVASTIIYTKFHHLPDIARQGIQSKKPEEIKEFQEALALATSVNDALFWMSVAFVVIGIGMVFAPRIPGVNNLVRKYALLDKIPFLGAYRKAFSIAVSMSACSSLLHAGARVTDSVRIVRDTVTIETVKRYWTSVYASLIEKGESTQVAFNHPPLSPNEYRHIHGHRNRTDLSDALKVISKEREGLLDGIVRRAIRTAGMSTMAYIAISAGVTIYAVMVQNQAVMASMRNITNPGG